MFFRLDRCPNPTTVASSPSPYPSWAAPDGQAESSYPDPRPPVPGPVPVTVYVPWDRVGTRVSGGRGVESLPPVSSWFPAAVTPEADPYRTPTAPAPAFSPGTSTPRSPEPSALKSAPA